MKYLKFYEELNIDKPEIGDYVLCFDIEEDDDLDKALNDFTSSNIGIIINIDTTKPILYSIRYEKIPKDIMVYFDKPNSSRVCFEREIIHWSKNKEELETILTAKKHNL